PLSLLGSVLRSQTSSPSPPATLDIKPPTSAPPAPEASAAPRPDSSGSDGTPEKLHRPSRRSKTSFNIARPVNTRSKLHSRPKVHLQLHQLIASKRPKPAYDVVPFSSIPQRSARRLATSFNTRDKLGSHDLLVVKAGPYSSEDEQERSDEHQWNPSDVIGVLSTRKCDKSVTETTDICLNDGLSRWSVADMPNGGYEFTNADEHGLTLKVRWVLKPGHTRRSSMSAAPSTATDDKKFTFSTIAPDSRRHPIIATMTRSRIDVMDTYTIPSASSSATPSVPSYTHSPSTTPSINSESFADDLTDKLPLVTTESIRNLILVTGVWVASKEFASDSTNHATIPARTPSGNFRPSTHRNSSMSTLDSPPSPSPASTLNEKHRSIPRLLKSSPRPRRANSTGGAIHSISGSLRKKYRLSFEDDTLIETAEERQLKRSIELLRVRELALPVPIERLSAETTRASTTTAPFPTVTSPSSEDSHSPAPLLASPLLSPPATNSERSRKTQSGYAPVTTTGMWDSGVTQGPGLKTRPTSMFVMNEKKRKQQKKDGRSKSKDRKTKQSEGGEQSLGIKRKSDWYMYKIKLRLKDMFKKEKA
ncbi:uncharacterized protein SETTUDRAFT_73979, partial [Exserohilum turcica Et28A]